MVKSKKMSKTSIAIIVLALLLVLSLVMGMTGAWFTSAPADQPDAEFTFGTVTISINDAAWGAEDIDGEDFSESALRLGSPDKHIMPGDHIVLEGEVSNLAEAAYVYMTYSAKVVKVGEGDLASRTEDLSDKCSVTAPAGWTLLTKTLTATADQAAAYNAFHGYESGDNGYANAGEEIALPVQLNGSYVYYAALASAGDAQNGDELAFEFDYNLEGSAFGDVYEGAAVTVSATFEAIQQANLADAVAGFAALGHDVPHGSELG